MYRGVIRASGATPAALIRDLARAVEAILRGNVNSGGAVTLTASSTTTVISNHLISPDSILILTPTTATAAAAMASVYQTVTGKNEITLTHNNTADTDRDFKYVVLG